MTRRTRFLITVPAAAVVAAVIFGVGVHAYSTYAKWGSNRVTFYANPANADVSDSAAESSLVQGAGVWGSQSGASIRIDFGGRVTDNSTSYDSRNVVIFRNATSDSAIASTYSWWSGSTLVDSDIIFWDGGFTFFSGSGCGGSNAAYIEDIAAHEFGHFLGLNHSTVADATMYPSYSTCSQSQRTLTSDDIAGVQALYPPTTSNTAPTAFISAPSGGATFTQGTSIAFSGSATDTQDGNLSSRLSWTSSIDGQIGTGSSFSRSLTAGSHVITASVTDNGGLSASQKVSITVASSNTAPTVSISAPSIGASYPQGASITFSGSASDAQDGNLSSRITWKSSQDGQIGSGSSFSRTLSAGTHVITASATDGTGLSGTAQVTVTVSASAPSVGVPSLTVRTSKVKGTPTADLSWSGLTSSQVDVYADGAKVVTTQNDGQHTDSIDAKGKVTRTYRVCDQGTSSCTNSVTVTF